MNEPTMKGLTLLGCALALTILRWFLKRHEKNTPDLGPVEARNTKTTIIMCAVVAVAAVVIGLWFLARGRGLV